MPNGILPVSPCTISTWSKATPSWSATSWANVVSWPWPWLCEPVKTVMLPVGWAAHFRRLVEGGAGTKLARHHRGCHGAGLNIGADTDTAQLAAFRGLLPSPLEAGVIGSFHRHVECL